MSYYIIFNILNIRYIIFIILFLIAKRRKRICESQLFFNQDVSNVLAENEIKCQVA